MKRLILALLVALAGSNLMAAADAPDLKEVLDLLRANLAGANESELNRAAVEGLISKLSPKVTLAGEPGSAGTTNSKPTTTVYDHNYGYIRLKQIGPDADKQVGAAFKDLKSTNRLRGLVLDLRFADGQDYSGATALADWFCATEQPLLDYGDGLKKSAVKTNAFALPLAILVNGQTSGSAEAFVAALRQAGVGLVLGSKTAGHANIYKEFTLKTGQRLLIATTPVKLGDGKSFPSGGFKPDIQVDVAAEDERAYLEDAYRAFISTNQIATLLGGRDLAGGTNRPPRRRINEADLVRMLREGQNLDQDLPAPMRDTELPRLVNDPVLARALDILKGLAVVQQSRSI